MRKVFTLISLILLISACASVQQRKTTATALITTGVVGTLGFLGYGLMQAKEIEGNRGAALRPMAIGASVTGLAAIIGAFMYFDDSNVVHE